LRCAEVIGYLADHRVNSRNLGESGLTRLAACDRLDGPERIDKLARPEKLEKPENPEKIKVEKIERPSRVSRR
jgi:hypothetical protein